MSTAPIKPEFNQGFPIQTHSFFNWSTASTILGDYIIQNILRIYDQTDVEHFIITEFNEPRITQNLLIEAFKLNQECFTSESIEPYTEALDIVNLMDHNKEMLDRPELLAIERVMDFSNAYPNIFKYLVNHFDING